MTAFSRKHYVILSDDNCINGKYILSDNHIRPRGGNQLVDKLASHTGVMAYDEACFMHLTPGVVHNFPKAVGV